MHSTNVPTADSPSAVSAVSALVRGARRHDSLDRVIGVRARVPIKTLTVSVSSLEECCGSASSALGSGSDRAHAHIHDSPRTNARRKRGVEKDESGIVRNRAR